MLKTTQLKSRNIKQLRLHNAQVVLELLYKNRVMSKSQLSTQTQLTLPAIANILRDLQQRHLVESVDRKVAVRGNSDLMYTIAVKPWDTLCLSLSPTKLCAVIVDQHMLPKHELITLTIFPLSPQQLIEHIISLYQTAVNINQNKPLRLAMAIHGQVDTDTGSSLNMPQACWKEPIEFKYILEQQLNTSVLLDNDCVMLALAEKWIGGQSGEDFCVLNVDYGIGSSFLINNEVYRGKLFGSGQIGHTIIDPDGKKCGCGRYGCLETVASSNAMLVEIRKLMKNELQKYQHINIDKLTFKDCIDLFHQHDSNVVNVIDNGARKLGLSLYNFILTLNINQIILYGETRELGECWRDKITQQVLYNPFESLADLKQHKTLIRFGRLSETQLLMGIGFLFVEQELKQLLL